MAPLAKKITPPATYGDYLSWSGEERWEIIAGEPINMGPAPMRRHQAVSVRLTYLLFGALRKDEKSRCQVFHAPFDVRFPEGDEADRNIQTVVQPDIVLVCDPTKLDDRGCRGAPDLVIEILSSGTLSYDLKRKRDLYERHRVPHYWAVHPDEKFIITYRLTDTAYGKDEIYEENDLLPVPVLPGTSLPLREVFADHFHPTP